MHAFRSIFLTLLVFGSTPLFATESGNPGGFQLKRPSSIRIEPVQVLESTPGETREAFLRRANDFMVAWTDEHNFEVCAAVCESTSGNAWVLPLTTSRSHLGCAVNHRSCPVDFSSNRLTIHTHADTSGFRVTKADAQFTGGRLREGMNVTLRTDKDVFSTTDFAGGPGFLATPKGLLFQEGPGHVTSLIAP
jgi:hypothetical protein